LNPVHYVELGNGFAEATGVSYRTWAVASGGIAAVVAVLGGCVRPSVAPTGMGRPNPTQLAELWIDPDGSARNLFEGVGGDAPAPAADSRYEVLERDTRGFSITYRVKDTKGAEWNVKIGPEAQTEVVASRIVWALGYHQVPSYFVERWIAVNDDKAQTLGGARFRPRTKAMGLESKGTWSWQQNPFVHTRQYNGLLALMMLLNSTDLKNDNNELYKVDNGERREGATQWYVVKDLGASLGETGRFDPRRGYIDGFEREPFTVGVQNGFVRFAFRGRHQELLEGITVEDVKWISQRVLRISDRQWNDAFRAGGYPDDVRARFIARIKQKATEGLSLR
jgi:hypothetical protein